MTIVHIDTFSIWNNYLDDTCVNRYFHSQTYNALKVKQKKQHTLIRLGKRNTRGDDSNQLTKSRPMLMRLKSACDKFW